MISPTTGPPTVMVGCVVLVALTFGCGGITQTSGVTASPDVGSIMLGNNSPYANDTDGWADAEFLRARDYNCVNVAHDTNCELLDCPGAAPPTPFFDPSIDQSIDQSIDAGTITVVANQTVLVERSPDGVYVPAAVSGPLWKAGDTITVYVPGVNGDPPTFTATLTGPEPIEVSSPITPTTVDRNQGFTVSWAGGTSGLVTMHSFLSRGITRTFNCKWDVSANAGSISSGVLSGMPAGGLTISVAAADEVSKSVGSWNITATATQYASAIRLELQ